MFTTAGILAAPGLVGLGVSVVREGRCSRVMFFVWSVVTLVATLRQNRFAYYAIVNVAVLGGAASYEILRWVGFWALESRGGWKRWWVGGVGTLGLAGIVFYPHLPEAVAVGRRSEGIPASWREALAWMRRETPEPFGDAGYYLVDYGNDVARLKKPAYSVLSWWDYGYWIIHGGRRVPAANPTQAGAGEVAPFFVSQSEDEAISIARGLGANYVVVDCLLPKWLATGAKEVTGKVDTIVRWAGGDPEAYAETYYLRKEDGALSPVVLYDPAYYRCMLTRLLIFQGRKVTARDTSHVVTFSRGRDGAGRDIKVIEGLELFPTFAQARRFAEGSERGDRRVVGVNPMVTCVSLEKVKRFRSVFRSSRIVARGGSRAIPYVEVFEVVRP
jgi:dolichyl-diphosphooligosaccharide--protein glycosyltransferase